MKQIIFLLGICIATSAAMGADSRGIDKDQHVFTPEEEAQYWEDYSQIEILGLGRAARFKFPQTTWNECSDEITGNYYGYGCASNRNISVILKKFIDTYIYSCVDKGLAAQGGGVVNELHIVHAGIMGDPNHAPKSLHSENRAIDIKSLEMKLTSGAVKTLVYQGTTNRKFYTAFRACWGNVVNRYNTCPFYKGTPGLTGSIGWENADHQRHLHVSVPYCINGKYSTLYYQK